MESNTLTSDVEAAIRQCGAWARWQWRVKSERPGGKPMFKFFPSLRDAEYWIDCHCAGSTVTVSRRLVFPYMPAPAVDDTEAPR